MPVVGPKQNRAPGRPGRAQQSPDVAAQMLRKLHRRQKSLIAGVPQDACGRQQARQLPVASLSKKPTAAHSSLPN
jgi:hypothetical protein